MISIVSLVVSFIYTILICIVYILKDKIKSEETKIYSYLLGISLLTIILDFSTAILYIEGVDITSSTYLFLSKCVIVSYIMWDVIMLTYVLSITIGLQKIKNKGIIIALLIISCLTILLLPMNIQTIDGNVFPTGYAIYIFYIVTIILVVSILFTLLINHDKLRDKKYIPFISFLLLGTFAAVFQTLTNNMIMTPVMVFITNIMYFTIENPDVKLVEYEKTEKERAEAASLAKSEFLSSMSHELRTPLNAIVGLSEDIDSYKDKVPSEVREDTKDIINASNTLLEIIGSILDISKIESGKLDIVEGNYDPREEFESVAKINRTKFSEKKLEFNVKIADNLPEVLYGDRLRIKQILNNFLSNAYKYTDGGHVDYIVNWLDASGSLQIIVSDTGRGVKPEDIDKLFAKYDRLGVEKSSNVQGTGLGLAITKTLIDLMGGTVKVDSEYLVGTTFTVTLPQKLGDKEELERIKKENEKVVEKLDYTGKRILVVDDNMLNIKVLKKAIKEFNFIIDECYNGKEAIEKIEMNNNYDIVLLDILMPIMRGDEAINYIRNMPNFHSPVVALTADAMTGAKEKYQAMGFDDYLAKPFTRDAIAKKLSSILGNGKEEKPKKEKSNLENTATINVKEVNVTVNNYNNEGK